MLGGNMNIMSLMKNFGKIQEMMTQAQGELEKVEVTGESGAGAVKVIMNAKHVAKSVSIDDEILKEDKAIVEELVMAAINDAESKIAEIIKDKMGDAGKMLGDTGIL